jgi:hypothetical protein
MNIENVTPANNDGAFKLNSLHFPDTGVIVSQDSQYVYATCSAFAMNGEVITGNSEGLLMVWKGNKVVRTLQETHQVRSTLKLDYNEL